MIRIVALAALVVSVPFAGSAQPAKPPEIVCEFTGFTVGHMEGRVFREDQLDPEDFVRFTFRGHDPKAGTAKMLVNDDPAEQLVEMSVDKGAIVYLLEEPGTGKLMVSTAAKPSPEGWSAIATRHTWDDGDLSVKLMTGICRARAVR